LEEFKAVDVCRESICKHIFHKECLDTWIIKHEVYKLLFDFLLLFIKRIVLIAEQL